MEPRTDGLARLIRFGLNGLAATVVHFSVLYFAIAVLRWSSAGLANLTAAVCGMAVSYLGNRYFVFRRGGTALATQLSKFVVLYSFLAVFHGVFLYIWSDLGHADYRVGFVVATGIQAVAGYFVNRNIVFKSG